MTQYIAKVNGIAWAGYKASTEYTFNHSPTKLEIKQKAGDFQVITSARVIEVSKNVRAIHNYRF